MDFSYLWMCLVLGKLSIKVPQVSTLISGVMNFKMSVSAVFSLLSFFLGGPFCFTLSFWHP